jgi:hypothetical protein
MLKNAVNIKHHTNNVPYETDYFCNIPSLLRNLLICVALPMVPYVTYSLLS